MMLAVALCALQRPCDGLCTLVHVVALAGVAYARTCSGHVGQGCCEISCTHSFLLIEALQRAVAVAAWSRHKCVPDVLWQPC